MRRWWEAPVIVLSLVLVFAGCLAASRDEQKRTNMVVTTNPISRGAIIVDRAVRVAKRVPFGDQGVLSNLDDVVGKVALTRMPPNRPVHREDVARADQVYGRVPITVPAPRVRGGPSVGENAVVLVSPRTIRSSGLVLEQVPILAITGTGETSRYTVAVRRGDLGRLADRLGFSDVRVARPY